MDELRVWKLDDGSDHWIVAPSLEDAEKQLRELLHSWGLDDEDIGEITGVALEPTKELTMHDEDGPTIKLTCAEWAARGRAYLGCSEW